MQWELSDTVPRAPRPATLQYLFTACSMDHRTGTSSLELPPHYPTLLTTSSYSSHHPQFRMSGSSSPAWSSPAPSPGPHLNLDHWPPDSVDAALPSFSQSFNHVPFNDDIDLAYPTVPQPPIPHPYYTNAYYQHDQVATLAASRLGHTTSHSSSSHPSSKVLLPFHHPAPLAPCNVSQARHGSIHAAAYPGLDLPSHPSQGTS